MAVVLGMGIAFAGMSAQAATSWTRNLDTGATTGGAPSAAVGGYADNNGAGNLVSVTATEYPLNGYGICSSTDIGCTEPSHALDNVGNQEALLLSFGSAVTLNSITIGYKSGDSDITVLAYTGSGIPSTNGNLTGHSFSQLSANSWTVIGSYGDLAVKTAKDISANSTGTSSSYWLIAAYNSLIGGTCKSGTCGNGNDYVKLYAIAGTTGGGGKVPEPSALLLFGTGLMGLVGLRRRTKGKTA
jgi:hypothetical protein